MVAWSTARIGDILQKSESWVSIIPDNEYKEITVRLWGRGVSLRGIKSGSEIGASRRIKVSPGQFIVSRIDARHGAFGLVPEELDGAVVTNDFPVFIPNPDRLSVDFLGWLSKTPIFVDACKMASEGTTNRVRLKENCFAEIRVSLPPLNEQRNIVAKIESLSSKIDEARQLRQAIQNDAQAMLHSAFQQIVKSAEYCSMAEVAPIVRRPVMIEPDGKYLELGVRSFGKGVFHKPTLIGAELDWQKLYRIHTGDLVISNIKAWEGAIAVASNNDHERVGSHRYITCVPQDNIITSGFLCFYLLSDEGIKQVQAASPGSADRNRTLAIKRLEKIKISTPPFNKQLWFNRLQAQVAAIHQTQTDNQVELDALLPSLLSKAFKGEL